MKLPTKVKGKSHSQNAGRVWKLLGRTAVSIWEVQLKCQKPKCRCSSILKRQSSIVQSDTQMQGNSCLKFKESPIGMTVVLNLDTEKMKTSLILFSRI